MSVLLEMDPKGSWLERHGHRDSQLGQRHLLSLSRTGHVGLTRAALLQPLTDRGSPGALAGCRGGAGGSLEEPHSELFMVRSQLMELGLSEAGS